MQKKKRFRLALLLLSVIGLFGLTGCSKQQMMVFQPAGPVGRTELHLIMLSIILIAAVLIPVFAILVFIIIRYRDKPGNKAPYTPNWNDSKVLEVIWWGIPIVIIAILGISTTKATYTLTKPPVANTKPITIQVTSLDWKWLFEYPGQHIATVNYVDIPAGVPVQFILTADAPMNSFWIPRLGGQEYTMPGMAMRLWLQADKPGQYYGTGANFTGKGFAHMSFTVNSKTQSDFNNWVKQVKGSSPALTNAGYKALVKPGTVSKQSYASFPADIFKQVVQKNGGKYMKMDNMTKPQAGSTQAPAKNGQ